MFGNAPSMQVRFAIAWEVPEVNPPLSAPDALGLTSEDVHHLAVGVPAGARIEYCDGSVGKGASAHRGRPRTGPVDGPRRRRHTGNCGRIRPDGHRSTEAPWKEEADAESSRYGGRGCSSRSVNARRKSDRHHGGDRLGGSFRQPRCRDGCSGHLGDALRRAEWRRSWRLLVSDRPGARGREGAIRGRVHDRLRWFARRLANRGRYPALPRVGVVADQAVRGVIRVACAAPTRQALALDLAVAGAHR